MLLQDSGSDSVKLFELIRRKYVLAVQPKYKLSTPMNSRLSRPRQPSTWAQFKESVKNIQRTQRMQRIQTYTAHTTAKSQFSLKMHLLLSMSTATNKPVTTDQKQSKKDEGSWPNDCSPESNKSSRPAEWDDYFNQSPHYVELIGYGLEYN